MADDRNNPRGPMNPLALKMPHERDDATDDRDLERGRRARSAIVDLGSRFATAMPPKPASRGAVDIGRTAGTAATKAEV
jgi:hypothetical protein